MISKSWLTYFVAALIITFFSGLVYVSVQQSYRSGADDPQLQIARDIALALKDNHSIDHLLPKDTVDLAESLSDFVALYNSNGDPVQSTGLLDGNMPKLPKGVFDFAKANNENVFTWQPRSGVRMALVVESVHASNISFVAAGRSLQEVQKRESNLTKMVFIVWILCIGVILVAWTLSGRFQKKIS